METRLDSVLDSPAVACSEGVSSALDPSDVLYPSRSTGILGIHR